MHRDSGYFLSGEKDFSASRNTGYKCILRRQFGKSSVFQLISFYKSKKIGDTININNSVVIKNINNNCYLAYDAGQPIKRTYPVLSQAEDALRPDVMHSDPYCKMNTCYYSSDASVGWSFDRLIEPTSVAITSTINANGMLCLMTGVDSSAPVSSKTIKSGLPIFGLDVISLDHPELQAELSSDIIYGDGLPEVYFRSYKGRFSFEYRSLNSLWQIEHTTRGNQGSVFMSVEDNEHVLSSSLTTNMFRLRHFLTGRLMMVKSSKILDIMETRIENQILLKREIPDSKKDAEEDFSPEIKAKSTLTSSGSFSIGGLEQNPSEADSTEMTNHLFNFEFVIIEEKFLRNKCLVYLQSDSDPFFT